MTWRRVAVVVQAAIVNASSLDEIHELESALKSGNLPAGLLK